MKAEIHPKYDEVKATCSCGNVVVTRSTLCQDFHLDVCSACHPFYTGEQRIVDTAGQVERFMNRLKSYGSFTEEKEERAQQAQEKRDKTFLNQQILALDLSDRVFQILTDFNSVVVSQWQEGQPLIHFNPQDCHIRLSI